MDVKCQSRTRRVPVVLVAAIAVFNAFAAPIASQPQDGNQFAGPVCSVPPAPDADSWPVAGPDALGSITAGTSLSFSIAALLANDSGTSLTVQSITPHSYGRGTIAGAGPFTYTSAARFVGTDSFAYQISDAAGRTTVGVVTVKVLADTVAPAVTMTSPLADDTVKGVVTLRANATDNVGIVGVTFFDGATPIGAEVRAAPFQTAWSTGLLPDGPHTLTAVARDPARNTTTSAAVVVNVSNAPTVDAPNVIELSHTAR